MLQRKTLRRWNNAIHRDLGYFFFGMTIIYALSGIILNHFKSGDFKHPDYSTSYKSYTVPLPSGTAVDEAYVMSILEKVHEKGNYKSYITGTGYVSIYLKNGSVYVDLNTGEAEVQKKMTRYVLKEFNLLHYNNIKKFYTWFSDAYAVGLILLAITGLFVLRGKNGLIGRGAWITAAGILIPALIILFYA
jgi:uncharacterized protein